jgi:hypothetical protein
VARHARRMAIDPDNELATLRLMYQELRSRREKLVSVLDEERGRLIGLTASAAFIVSIFVAFRPKTKSTLVDSLYVVGLLPFVALMLGLALYGIFGLRVRLDSSSPFSSRFSREGIAHGVTRALYGMPWSAEGELPNGEREWLELQIGQLSAAKSPGIEWLLIRLKGRRKALEISSGALALEVAWLVSIALLTPFID